MPTPPVTLCMTIGNRPAMLRQTLESLLSHNHFHAVIAINDFGDEASSAVYRELCPVGLLLVPPAKLMQHRAIDLMYSYVETPLIFHCEDDWLFEPTPLLEDAYRVLSSDRSLNSVCVAHKSEWPGPKDSERWQIADGVRYRVCGDQVNLWGSFTFHPTLIRRSLWEHHGPYSRFTSEGKIGRWMKRFGLHTAYLDPGFGHHLGVYESVNRYSRLKRLKRSAIKRYHAWIAPDTYTTRP